MTGPAASPKTSEADRSSVGDVKALLRDRRNAEALAVLDGPLSGRETAELLSLRGIALGGLERWGEAERAFARSTELDPDERSAWFNLASARLNAAAYMPAIDALRQLGKRWPNDREGRYLLANILKDCGQVQGAIGMLQEVLRIDPGRREALSNLLVCLNCVSDDPLALTKAHLGGAEQFRPALRPAVNVAPPLGPENPHKRLTIGYLSADMRRHPVACFLKPVLRGHDPQRVGIVCYSDVDRADDVTEAIRAEAEKGADWRWRDVAGIGDRELIETIRADAVDVLVELNGHTQGNRLSALSMRAAPVQATYLGYPCTTGAPNIDLRLTDEAADPSGADDRRATEKLVRLPHGFHAFAPLEEAPPVGALPLRRNGFVTYGCYNNVSKITPDHLGRWVEILSAAPASRLRLKGAPFADPKIREIFLKRFERRGVDPSRIQLNRMQSTTAEHLRQYGEIDIALDTFPYNGTTTTCEAMWMGVPVVSLHGRAHNSRVGLSLLTAVGLADLACGSAESYVSCAIQLARDIDRLTAFRGALRQRMQDSPLGDGRGLAREIERALSAAWRERCRASAR